MSSWNTTSRGWGLAIALALAVTGSARAQDGFLKLGDIGEEAHANGMEILGISWGGPTMIMGQMDVLAAEPPPGARTVRILKRVDKSTPLIAQALARNQRFPEATLTVPKGGGSQGYTVTMSEVIITSFQTGGTEARPTDTLTLNFTSIKFNYLEKKPPAPAGPEKAGYDLKKAEKAAAGPGEGPPAAELVAAVADLLPLNGLTVATSFIAWGQTATISTDAASSKQGGRCFFRYRYDTGNQGQAGAGATTNRIHLDAANGPSLADDALAGLAAGDQQTSSGLLPLVVGTWTLYVHVDDDLVVAEGDEQNNLRRVRVRVEGSCEDEAPTPKDATPPSPPAEIPSAIGFPPSIEVENDADTDAPLGSRHSGVIQIAMMDGSVRMVSGSIRVVEPKDLAQSGGAAAGQGPRLLQACAQGEPIKVEVERGSTLEAALSEAYRKKMPFGVLQDTDAMGHSCKVTSVEPSMSDPQMLVFYLGGY